MRVRLYVAVKVTLPHILHSHRPSVHRSVCLALGLFLVIELTIVLKTTTFYRLSPTLNSITCRHDNCMILTSALRDVRYVIFHFLFAGIAGRRIVRKWLCGTPMLPLRECCFFFIYNYYLLTFFLALRCVQFLNEVTRDH